jgi:plastocyanin
VKKINAFRMLSISGLGALLMLLALLFVPMSASAHAVVPAGVHQAASATVKIVKSSKGYHFKPKEVTVTQGETATLDNTTSISQTITYRGIPIYTIPAHSSQSEQVNFTPGTYVVNLQSNPKAKLTIIVQ